ncbi:copper homeostasis protein like protein [Heterostelium album PN500]|uniref:Copper homeostasis protein cutC homolog n=1 Tax=Heterostelium pallidum (strain ATCC 26659 / Pp 5 / PN500) TaxID=670386 RepID=D3BUK7_HETP5|nr:copper homeostasis protein like protein [Heterostelium album PN500]EFA74795.1 copper homeostasis protein like protein [Heterostelium album PN500]|eukprot:XP_020426929.1 copper homeostasis protein like protein [Heterostelium album PN500]
MSNQVGIEVCVDSLQSCLEAVKGGAIRLELCSALFLGGLTPSYGLMKIVKQKLPDFQINVMIRPRDGDFLYSDEEIEIMKHEIDIAKSLNFNGVVFGVLNANGTINKETTKMLIEYSNPLSVTFHRAIDMCRDYKEAMNDLISVGGIDRVLTSGLESSVMEGIDTIIEMIKMVNNAGSKMIIMPGGGVTERNINKIVKTLNIKEIHLSGRIKLDSSMQFRNTRVFMGGELRQSEYQLAYVDQNKIKSFQSAANQ